jgi:hypothetical protein
MTNPYKRGWDNGRQLAENFEAADQDVVYLAGFAAGFDQHVHGAAYAELEKRRLQIEFEGAVPAPGEREFLEFWRRIQAERTYRCTSEDGSAPEVAISYGGLR